MEKINSNEWITYQFGPFVITTNAPRYFIDSVFRSYKWRHILISLLASSPVSSWLVCPSALPHRPSAAWSEPTTCLRLTGKCCTTWVWCTWPCSSTPRPSTSLGQPSTWTPAWGSSTCCWQVQSQRDTEQIRTGSCLCSKSTGNCFTSVCPVVCHHVFTLLFVKQSMLWEDDGQTVILLEMLLSAKLI